RRRPPRQRVHVRAAVTVVAVANEVDRLEAELERGELRVLPELLRCDLVRGDPQVNVGAFRPLRVYAAQPGSRSARMIAAAVVIGASFHLGQVAQHERTIPERLERAERRRELEAGTGR